MVEELDNSRIKSETFDTNGRVVRGRVRDNKEQDDGSYYGDNEVDTVGTSSVSAFSENDMDWGFLRVVSMISAAAISATTRVYYYEHRLFVRDEPALNASDYSP
jgi:hypothetical protein